MAEKVLRVFDEGVAPFLAVDPDGMRAAASHKSRKLVSKLSSARDAVERYVVDGDYVVWECSYLQRGPAILLREIARQRKRRLWACGKFSWVAVALLVEAGCVDRADMSFFMGGPALERALLDKGLRIFEYSNLVMTARLRAGAMGATFIPVRSLGGTDNFRHSGAKRIEDPYTGKSTVVVPALNPDVALIHVQQCDVYGNARISGAGVTDVESALASKRVILSTEEIIGTEEIRRDPSLTKIPYYLVDAVVHAPFGAYPGECPGHYASDAEHLGEIFSAMRGATLAEYLETWVHSVADDREMLERRVGAAKLESLRVRSVEFGRAS